MTTSNSFDKSHDIEREMDNRDDDDYAYSSDEDDDDNLRVSNDKNGDINGEVMNELMNTDDDEPSMTSMRENFQGINFRDNTNIEDLKSCFGTKINHKTKYLHQQLAGWLLTDENIHTVDVKIVELPVEKNCFFSN